MKTAARYTKVFRCKYLADDCNSLEEMANRLEESAKELRAMAAAGIQLSQRPVDDDYAFLETTDPKVAKKFGLEKDEEAEE